LFTATLISVSFQKQNPPNLNLRYAAVTLGFFWACFWFAARDAKWTEKQTEKTNKKCPKQTKYEMRTRRAAILHIQQFYG